MINRQMTTMPTTSPFRNSGFSLVELVITIIVIVILAAVVLPNMNAIGQHSVNTQADEFRRNLSHIQFMAISRSKRLRLTVSTGGYTVVECTNSACTGTIALTDPATGANFSVSLTNGVTFSSASTLDFDSLGRPQVGAVLIAAMRTFTLNGNGSAVAVAVRPITGFAS